MSNWYSEASSSNIAVSTRVRLARNLSGLPFPFRMTSQQREELKNRVKTAVKQSNSPYAKNLKFIDMADVPETEIKSMVERHIISPQFARTNNGKAIILSEDESISIMIGEEDHLRIQVILAGLQLEKAYEIAEQIDTALHESLSFAFDNDLGFLTECPTNLGTGLRASVMMHLPLCESTGQLNSISETVSKIGFTVRGIYGEGSQSEAGLYQISNQITLGISEKTAIDNLSLIASQIAEKETKAQQQLDMLAFEDKVFRTLGILQNCRILESREMMNLLSLINLGIRLGILNNKYAPIKMLIEAQPNMLMKKFGVLTPEDRDIKRAELIREHFNS